MTDVVYLNGEFMPLAEARVPVLDRGFIFGDGVYELVPVYSRVPFRLDEHLARLERSLGAVGIRVDVVAEPFDALLGRLRETKDFELFLLGWAGGGDPDSARGIWTTGGSQNYGGYSNATVDRLFAQGLSALDAAERKPLYVQIQQRIAEDQPYVFLWTLESLWAVNPRIGGIEPSAYGALETRWNVNEWYTSDGK